MNHTLKLYNMDTPEFIHDTTKCLMKINRSSMILEATDSTHIALNHLEIIVQNVSETKELIDQYI